MPELVNDMYMCLLVHKINIEKLTVIFDYHPGPYLFHNSLDSIRMIGVPVAEHFLCNSYE